MSVQFFGTGGSGARASAGGGGLLDMGFTNTVPPEMAAAWTPTNPRAIQSGATWVALIAVAVLAVSFVHWKTY